MTAPPYGHFRCVHALIEAGADAKQLKRAELAALVQFDLRGVEEGDADARGRLAELASRREIAAWLRVAPPCPRRGAARRSAKAR
jgi:hypothetical protein